MKIVLQLGIYTAGEDAPGGGQISTGRTKDFGCILRATLESPLPTTRMQAPVGSVRDAAA